MVSENSGDVRLEGTEGQDGTVGGLGGALKDGQSHSPADALLSRQDPSSVNADRLEVSLPLTVGILADPMIMWPEMGLCPRDSLVLESWESPSFLQSLNVAQTYDPLASASQVLGLQVCCDAKLALISHLWPRPALSDL